MINCPYEPRQIDPIYSLTFIETMYEPDKTVKYPYTLINPRLIIY